MKPYHERIEAIQESTDSELDGLISLCIGRLFRLGSRPTEPGDMEMYEEIKTLALEADTEIKHRVEARAFSPLFRTRCVAENINPAAQIEQVPSKY